MPLEYKITKEESLTPAEFIRVSQDKMESDIAELIRSFEKETGARVLNLGYSYPRGGVSLARHTDGVVYSEITINTP